MDRFAGEIVQHKLGTLRIGPEFGGKASQRIHSRVSHDETSRPISLVICHMEGLKV